jgi:hypothetical protein
MGPVRLPGTMWLDSYQRRDEAETAEQRTIKLRLQHGYRESTQWRSSFPSSPICTRRGARATGGGD